MFTKKLLLKKVYFKDFVSGQLLSLILFGLMFGLVKINSVSAVFVSASLSPSLEVFGLLDYALAVGIILSIPLNAGLTGAYPYFILKLKKVDDEVLFFYHGLATGLGYFMLRIGCCIININYTPSLHLILIISSIFSLQILASVIYKSNGKIFKALIFDAGFFVILNTYNLYLFINNGYLEITTLNNFYTIYLFALIIFYAIKSIQGKKGNWTSYLKILRFGFPLITASLLIIGLTGSARIIIERWIGMEAVGVYGLYFRLAALVVLLHQVVNIAFFKKIYTSHPIKLDSWFSSFIVFISLISIVSFVLIPHLLLPYLDLINDTWLFYSSLYVILCFQMVFWITLALFENIIYREKLSRNCNRGLALLFIMMLCTLFITHTYDYLNLTLLVGVNTAVIYLACEWQIFLLGKKELLFPKMKKAIRIIFSLLFIYTIL
jgi:hypothetical protein